MIDFQKKSDETFALPLPAPRYLARSPLVVR